MNCEQLFDTKYVEYRDMWLTVRQGAIPHYLTNDEAHKIDHADEVLANALCILEMDHGWVLPDQVIPMAIYAAYAHDMFCDSRRNHHELAFEFVLYQAPVWRPHCLTMENVEMVAYAVREHRASWKHGYTSHFSELIACADRGVPRAMEYIARSYRYAISKHKYSPVASVAYAIDHIYEKFGSKDGSAKMPEVYRSLFRRELEQLRDELSVYHQDLQKIPQDALTGYDLDVYATYSFPLSQLVRFIKAA